MEYLAFFTAEVGNGPEWFIKLDRGASRDSSSNRWTECFGDLPCINIENMLAHSLYYITSPNVLLTANLRHNFLLKALVNL